MTNPLQPGRQEEARNDLAHMAHDNDLVMRYHRVPWRIRTGAIAGYHSKQQAFPYRAVGAISYCQASIPVNMNQISQHVSVWFHGLGLSRSSSGRNLNECVCTRTTVKVDVEKVARSNDEGAPLIGSGCLSAKYHTPTPASTLNTMSQTDLCAAPRQRLLCSVARKSLAHARSRRMMHNKT